MDAYERRSLTMTGLVASPPLLLALLEWFHPHPHDLLGVDVGLWLFVHYAQIPLFPLVALAVAWLLRGRHDLMATTSRVALFVFATSFVAFDTAAGVVTGILLQAAHASGQMDAWRAAIDTIWLHPIVGGVRQPDIPSLSFVGAAALSIATVTAAGSLWRADRPWPPLALLAVSGFGLQVFHTHAWPGGPLTFAGIAAATGWLGWLAARTTHAVHQRERAPIQVRASRERRSNWRPLRSHPAAADTRRHYL